MAAGSICGGRSGGGGAVDIWGGGRGEVQNRESPDFRSLEVGISEKASQCCQLCWTIRETPYFGPYLPVSRLESDKLLFLVALTF